MAELLNQDEIAALLNAADTGEIEEKVAHGELFTHNRREGEPVEIQPYDFKRPERVSKEQMLSLQTLHEGFARIFGAALSGFMRTIVEVKVAGAEQMTYSEFISGLPNPTCFNLIQPEPLEGRLCLELSPLIVYPIIDRLLGGSTQELFIPQRPMTMIESKLISVILERAMNALTEAWAGVKPVTFRLGDMESNPQLVQIVPPNEVVIVIGFEIKMSTRAGTMNLCLPFNVIEPVMEVFNAQNWFSVQKGRDTEEYARRVVSTIASAPLQVSGLLAETTMTLNDLLHLSVGDLILTEKLATRPVVLCVEGERKFLANIGQFKGNRALRILRPAKPDDRF